MPSRDIIVLDAFFFIPNLWAFPAPAVLKVIAVPAVAFDLLVANWNSSLVTLIA